MLNYESKNSLLYLSVFQNNGSIARVSRLKIAVNMADPTYILVDTKYP